MDISLRELYHSLYESTTTQEPHLIQCSTYTNWVCCLYIIYYLYKYTIYITFNSSCYLQNYFFLDRYINTLVFITNILGFSKVSTMDGLIGESDFFQAPFGWMVMIEAVSHDQSENLTTIYKYQIIFICSSGNL